MVKYSKDRKVMFDEETHTYWLGCKKLQSVSAYIAQYKPYFDKETISFYYAKKHGLNQQDVLDEWQRKADESCVMGSAVHKVFEDYILTGQINKSGDYHKEEFAEAFIVDFFKSGRLTPVETEFIVYNEDIAGQVDCIARDGHNNYYILDWKTNAEIKYEGYKGQKMKAPFNHLEDCNYNHYSIQLTTYSMLCNEYNIKGCYIVHLSDDGYEFIKTREI